MSTHNHISPTSLHFIPNPDTYFPLLPLFPLVDFAISSRLLGIHSSLRDKQEQTEENFVKSFCQRADLSKTYRELCDSSSNVIQAIARGAEMAVEECQNQFHMSRWNCSSTGNTTSTAFAGVLNTRE